MRLQLVDTAIARHADDNITAMVVRLFAPRPEEAVARQISRQTGRRVGPLSFVQLPSTESFVRVVGGF